MIQQMLLGGGERLLGGAYLTTNPSGATGYTVASSGGSTGISPQSSSTNYPGWSKVKIFVGWAGVHHYFELTPAQFPDNYQCTINNGGAGGFSAVVASGSNANYDQILSNGTVLNNGNFTSFTPDTSFVPPDADTTYAWVKLEFYG